MSQLTSVFEGKSNEEVFDSLVDSLVANLPDIVTSERQKLLPNWIATYIEFTSVSGVKNRHEEVIKILEDSGFACEAKQIRLSRSGTHRTHASTCDI
jgi:hypothetical protein